MKYLLCVLALLLSTFGFAFGQTPEPKRQEKDAPTLEETIKWISQNLPTLAGYESKADDGSTVTLRVVSVTFDGASGTISTRSEFGVSGGERLNNNTAYVFSLVSLDTEKIVVERKLDTDPPAYELKLNAKDGKNAIKQTSVSSGLLSSRREKMTAQIVLVFDSEETARRFEKAFKHAAKLSQASSKEPF